MGYYLGAIYCSSELYHHGVLGQKWGRRQYQNEDGSLTPLGREHYGRSRSSIQRRLNRLDKEIAYSKGDSATNYSKKSSFESEFKKLHSKGKVGKAYKVSRELKKTNDVIDASEKQRSEIKRQIDELIEMAGKQGYNVTTKPTSRYTTRTGKRIAAHFQAATMATVMAYLNPLGFGVGVGGSIGYTKGTRYKVREPK